MSFSTQALLEAVDAVHQFDGADVCALDEARLMDLQRATGELLRAGGVLAAQSAAEITRRSAPELGRAGFAKRRGFHTPEQLVATTMDSSYGDAARLVQVGSLLVEDEARVNAAAATAENCDAEGGASAMVESPLATAVRAGRLGTEKAAIIRNLLGSLPDDVDTTLIEERLVRHAARMGIPQLKRTCALEWAHANPAGLAEREKRQRAERSLNISEDATGMTLLTGRLDPATAAPFRAWMDAQVRHALQGKRDGNNDTRTAEQMRADALALLALHNLGCQEPSAGVKTTMIVRTNLTDLEARIAGAGEDAIATCDQLSTPISLDMLRRIAVDIQVIPFVMGGPSMPLDVGRARRLYSPYQKLALGERDGGCAQCHRPLSHCVGHHIDWWARDNGKTDMNNGVMLCVVCHNMVHDGVWEIRVNGDTIEFIPNSTVDPNREPLLGGLARLAPSQG